MMIHNMSAEDYLKANADPTRQPYRMVFMDPPDNIGYKYDTYVDKRPDYYEWLYRIWSDAFFMAPIVWLSVNHTHLAEVLSWVYPKGYTRRVFIWTWSFYQHRNEDCGNAWRPIIRCAPEGTEWDTEAIKVQSERQKLGDKRAKPGGKIPGDVWEFPRVCGNFKERRRWHPTQHPEALMERILRMSGKGPVLDLFLGSGTTMRVARKLGWPCHGVEIDQGYCEKVQREIGD